MIGSEGFPIPPTMGDGIGGGAGTGFLDALKGNPQLMSLLLMSLGSMGQSSPQSNPMQMLMRLQMMKQMMPPPRPQGMEGSPNMPGQFVGQGTGNPLSWLSSLLGGGGGSPTQ